MVDTIKLLVAINNPLELDGSRFVPTIDELVQSLNYGKATLNPSKSYAKADKYMPRLTMHKRPSKAGVMYQLAIEFSAPKIVFGNNFNELTDVHYTELLLVLQEKLCELTGHMFSEKQLATANVSVWHPSKNVVFRNYTACQTVLTTISKLDVSKVYDLQKTDFRDGHVVHIHCNSLDIAFYDKLADLRKAKLSEKRAFEKDSVIQISLLERLQKLSPLEIFRYEVRLVGRASIKRAFTNLEEWTLESLFKSKLCQQLLVKHWEKLTASVDMLALDLEQPYELLQNVAEENPNATPRTTLAVVSGLLIAGQVGIRELRNVLESCYGKDAWYSIKPLLKKPQSHRFKYFQHISQSLEHFEPTHMGQIV
ncbi:MAG: hypothetical protein WD467_00045 [Candidatus Saccharimonadales bacterium]